MHELALVWSVYLTCQNCDEVTIFCLVGRSIQNKYHKVFLKECVYVYIYYFRIIIGISYALIAFLIILNAEFWKQVPPSEPYRVILSDVRDKLYHTRERSHHLLSNGYSDIPEEATFTNVEQVKLLNEACLKKDSLFSFP